MIVGDSETFHPVAWSSWLLAVALPALITRNPLYLSLALAAAGLTYIALRQHTPLASSWGAFVKLGVWLWLFTIPFTALTSHYGELVLFRLPSSWPIIGGPITGEAILYGLTSGLALLTLLMSFAAFNVAVDQARLLRLTPRFLYQFGVVTAIAVGFVPQMVITWQAIRETQQLRGHKVRGVRDLLPLIVPLFVTALERAVQLAESMEARGFGAQTGPDLQPVRSGLPANLAVLAGLAALGAGLVGLSFWSDRPLLPGALLVAGSGLLAGAFWRQGRHVRRSSYRRWYWRPADRVVLALSLAVSGLWVTVWLVRNDWLFYYPYPPYSPWPAFQPLLGLALLALAVPALLAGEPASGKRKERRTAEA